MAKGRDIFSRKWKVYYSVLVVSLFCLTIAFIAVIRAKNILAVSCVALAAIVFGIWLFQEFKGLIAVFGANGVYLPTLSGIKIIEWSEVNEIAIAPPLVILKSDNKRYLISLRFYADQSQIIEYLQQKISMIK
jgi:hypothetical protein